MAVIENPREAAIGASEPTLLLRPKAERKIEPEVRGRTVFGITKNTLIEDTMPSASAPGIEIKAGNTLATAPDDRTLNPGDVQSLPIPSEEYLVTEMPKLMEDIRIPYPKEAREKGIEGPVIMELLVDAEGVVRDASLIEGPGSGLNEAALEAVRRLRFRPARIQKKAVAVKIRYIYRFILEK